jgi:hypothetical protein
MLLVLVLLRLVAVRRPLLPTRGAVCAHSPHNRTAPP